jgi:deoxyribodipyrimidine photo-lyase
MAKKYQRGLMWFRRDLRSHDNAALHHALRACESVFCVFIFDIDILDSLPRADRRVEFIRESLVELDQCLTDLARASGASFTGLLVRHGAVLESLASLAESLSVQAVFANRDDEPQSLARDGSLNAILSSRNVAFHDFKDHVIFERSELLTLDARPYRVFTPYRNAWLKKIDQDDMRAHDVAGHASSLAAPPERLRSPVPSLAELGFARTNLAELGIVPGSRGASQLLQDFGTRIDEYSTAREFPAVNGCSHLGIHLRFGTLSIREVALEAWKRQQAGSIGAATWLNELIWRDFYAQILCHFAHVATGAFKSEYDLIEWESGGKALGLFSAWCEGRTGYPLVDAAMAQINQTGYMHNRLRMVTASFLVKDLGIDWRWGEKYFAEKLNDFELASNNGGWQWAASTGCDAQPYFRIFNPVSQSVKFDSDANFIRQYLPALRRLPRSAVHSPWLASLKELEGAGIELGRDYPHPIVSHDEARSSTLRRFAVVRKPRP